MRYLRLALKTFEKLLRQDIKNWSLVLTIVTAIIVGFMVSLRSGTDFLHDKVWGVNEQNSTTTIIK